MTLTIPLGLRTALESGNAVLFVGAGIGANALGPDGEPAPNATDLAIELATRFNIALPEQVQLSQIAKIVELRHGRPDLDAFVAKRLAGLQPDSHLRWLFSIRWRAIFTTNYDNVIERSFELAETPPAIPVSISATSELVYSGSPFEVPIYHLHGYLSSEKVTLILTDDDYAQFRERRSMLFELLKRELATSTLIYIGYSNSDPNWKMVLSEITVEFAPTSLPPAYRIARSTDALTKEILLAKGIETIDASLEALSQLAAPLIDLSLSDRNRRDSIALRVPTQLLELFDKYPAPLDRLLRSWEYVNQAAFDEAPNIVQFLSGDLPNWSLVAKGIPFQRDVEEDVLDDLLDFATSAKPRTTTLALLGSAGFGVSTVLKTLAASLVDQGAGKVFSLRRGAQLLEGDVVFAASHMTEPCFFFIDNAADNVSDLLSIAARLRDLHLAAFLVLGERLNEWRQARITFRSKEHLVAELSDAEVDRLLDFLSKSHALGKLTDLDRNLQAAAIRERHGKQLLIVMREATEDNSFDAIIEDEYHGIINDLARRLYAIVSCFFHLRALARDELIAKVLDLSLEELHRQTSIDTEGVVVWECIDKERGTYAARARHHTVASIVWTRCVLTSDRDTILLKALSSLNLNYYVDRQAFDAFVRNDEQVSSISSFEGRLNFFELAAKKDPTSPYVFQHYARMLLREQKTELALAQIDHALSLAPRARSLHHTKGRVLASLAMEIESDGIARRRLAQSESSYQRSMMLGERDAHPYQGLADLYFGWAKRCSNEEESVTYISKAERTIGEGLSKVREKESLFIISSEIQRWLGQQPKSRSILEKAVREEPRAFIARYLLGRMLRRSKDYRAALAMLEPALESDPENVRVCVEYSRALIGNGESKSKAIAVLRQALLPGRNDPRFLALLGGLLFLDEKFSDAERVFKIAKEMPFTFQEAHRTQFRPKSPGQPEESLRFDGTIAAVKSGYCFVRLPGYPDLFLRGSKFGRWVAQVGQKVRIQLVFSALGPVALEPELLS